MFQIGEEYELHTKRPRQEIYDVKPCKVIQECNRFVVVDLGNYRESVDMYKLQTEEVKLIKKGEKEMPKKITKEQLFEECYNNGIDREALEEIAKKYDVAYITLYTYFTKWKIKEELKSKTSGEAPEEKKQPEVPRVTEEPRKTKPAHKTSYLKPSVFAGKLFNYVLLVENEVRIEFMDTEAVMNAEDIEIIIEELKELKQHIG